MRLDAHRVDLARVIDPIARIQSLPILDAMQLRWIEVQRVLSDRLASISEIDDL